VVLVAWVDILFPLCWGAFSFLLRFIDDSWCGRDTMRLGFCNETYCYIFGGYGMFVLWRLVELLPGTGSSDLNSLSGRSVSWSQIRGKMTAKHHRAAWWRATTKKKWRFQKKRTALASGGAYCASARSSARFLRYQTLPLLAPLHLAITSSTRRARAYP